MVVWKGRLRSYTPVRRNSVSTSLQLEAQMSFPTGRPIRRGEEDTASTVAQLYRCGYLIDTHTAVAAKVLTDYRRETSDTPSSAPGEPL